MKKKILIGVLATAGVLALTAGVYATWLMTPPGMPQTAEQAAGLMTSARFQRLSPERKEAYLTRMRELMGEMDDEQRRAFFEQNRGNDELREATREVFQEMQLSRARQLAAADPATRLAMIDQMIDEFGQLGGRGGFGGFGGGGPRGPRPDDADRPTREQIEQMSDEERAELREQMQQEREQRMAERVTEMQQEVMTGNPQDDALMREMRSAIRDRMRERGIGRDRGGPGGQRGGGGPGGRQRG